MNYHKFRALFKKDIKLAINNKNILLLYILPVGFALLYSNIFSGGDTEHDIIIDALLPLITLLGFGVVGSSTMGMSIAEEKEKRTLRSLMLSNVSGLEFIGSKLIVQFILFMISMTLSFFVLKAPLSRFPQYLGVVALTTFALLLASSLIGLFAKTQQSVGILGMPMMLLAMFPAIVLMTNSPLLTTIAKFTPTGPALFLLSDHFKAIANYPAWLGYTSLVVWIIMSALLFTFVYKKKQFDN